MIHVLGGNDVLESLGAFPEWSCWFRELGIVGDLLNWSLFCNNFTTIVVKLCCFWRFRALGFGNFALGAP